MEKYGFVYLWRDRKHKRYYVGSHWGNEADNYICSSSWMRQAYKHRPADFRRRILATNLPRAELYETEAKWLALIKEPELRVRYYNLHNRHANHWSVKEIDRRTVAEKISASCKGNRDFGGKATQFKPGNTPWLKGRKMPEYMVKMLRERAPSMLGKKHKPETIEKMRQSALNRAKNMKKI